MTTDQKLCRKCGVEKPIDQFSIRRREKDGRDYYCKPCKSIIDRDYRLRNIDRIREQNRERSKHQNPERKKEWRLRNRTKRRAHLTVGNALIRGKLQRGTACESCGSSKRLHAHHDDYAKPLEVRWLCPPCHGDWHRINGEGLNGV